VFHRVTKGSLIASVFFILHYKGYISVEGELLYLLVVSIFSTLRLLSAFSIDPFAPFENLFCSVFMGGVIDSLKRAAEKPEDVALTTAATATNKNNLMKAKEE